ncbi:PspC domain-containing protein [Pedobacter panaciterrae]|jgi:Putative stress-responsive transcriptional regulator|uniref:PspC domain-containing protein n=1 Tax=Pedobacter panaciterrae TaxID=363849 RepID=A0ABU8NIK8_9SPHI|nr:PspC domain-containing protein [Pedobacter panaciterrae]NQX54124.1 PspC domain-containing protein [Pedobacter panaciterrae]
MDKRLFRNEHEKVIAGVSSGVAEYMEVDVTIIRLLFVLSTIFLVGTGILVYIIMWIVVPVNNDPTKRFSKFNEFYKGPQNNPFNSPNAFSQPYQNPETSNPSQSQAWTSSTVSDAGFTTEPKQPEFKPYQKSDTGRTVGGLFLLVIGLYFLMNEFNIIPFWFSIGKLWPLVFVAIGVSFILKSKRKDAWEEWKKQNPQEGQTTDPVNPAPTPTDIPGNSNTGESNIDDRFTKKDI